MIPRLASRRLSERVGAFRVVIVNGPRQSGKTTLLRQIHEELGGTFRSLDDPTTLNVATNDPTEFANYGDLPRIIDEVHRGGDQLILAIKQEVDRHNVRGQFVLSGSTRFLTVPTLSESLAGRAVFLELWPLAMTERVGAPGDFCDLLFAGPSAFTGTTASPWNRGSYAEHFCAGGYPEAVEIRSPHLRSAWFDGYLSTVILRDVQSFAQIQHGALLPRLLGMLADRTGSLTVAADLAQGLDINHATARSYLSYLEIVFLTGTLPTWSANLTTRQIKTPKVYLTDSGLAAHLLQVDATALTEPGHRATARLAETFAYAEITRLLSASDAGASPYFYRDRDGREVDFILERRDGQLVALEIKSSSSVKAADFRHLIWLRDKLGHRFAGGYVLYLGPETHSFGDRLLAMPMSVMWHHRPPPDRIPFNR